MSCLFLKWRPIDLFASLFICLGFPGGLDGKESACGAGDQSLIPGCGRSPEEGNGNLLQYCLENPVGGGVWQTTDLLYLLAYLFLNLFFTECHVFEVYPCGTVNWVLHSFLVPSSVSQYG